ncbi:patatin-like phospholipase family protein [Caulobacter mirabilis]|uniref:Patatin n=1 Tax=Caulobacter mirabilis TaxID=69666 RepID=A0A2D2B132_9CAUL|nr:patatin-like phospholipase family protein [Caulobacter mirabilis]ATQ43970.1 patatin [Caulobacter mirabilis]
MTKALVLGGGGPVGIAWETGLVAGLADAGVAVHHADFILGTSAGSVVGSQLAVGRTPAEVLDGEFAYAEKAKEAEAGRQGPPPDLSFLMDVLSRRTPGQAMPQALMAELGAKALAAETVSEAVFLSGFPIPEAPWPERFACTAIDAETGEFLLWNKDTAAPLRLAVPSSCAVPTIFPPVTIDGRRYIDGGMRSGTNADMARDHGKVVIVAVVPPMMAAIMQPGLDREMAVIRDHGGEALLITPDAACGAAFGGNLMDNGNREAIARAGFAQGRAEAARVGAFWG